jgi:hypothetical protein
MSVDEIFVLVLVIACAIGLAVMELKSRRSKRDG